MMGKALFKASSSRRSSNDEYGDGIAAWVAENPDLIVPAQDRISPDRVHHWDPSHRRALKTVNKEDEIFWDLRLDLHEAGRVGESLRVEHCRHTDLLRPFARQTQGQWGCRVRAGW